MINCIKSCLLQEDLDNMRRCEHSLTNWDWVTGVVVMYVTGAAHDEVAAVTLTLAHRQPRQWQTQTTHRYKDTCANYSSVHANMCAYTHTIPSKYVAKKLLSVRDRILMRCNYGPTWHVGIGAVFQLLPRWLPVPLKSAWIPLDHVFMLACRNQNVVWEDLK